MFRKLCSIGAAGAMIAASMIAMPAAAGAQRYDDGYGGGYQRGYDGERRGYDGYRGQRYRGGTYYGRGRYAERGYQGDQRYYGRGHRCRDKGTGGTIIGAIAGGLLGNAAVGRHGDETAGTIVGAGVGALAGRAIDRDC